MGFDFDKVLNKLDREADRRHDERSKVRSDFYRECKSFISRVQTRAGQLQPPPLEKGSLLFRPVFSRLDIDPLVRDPVPMADALVETSSFVSDTSSWWKKTERRSIMCRVFAAKAYPSAMGSPVGPHWCVAPAAVKGGLVCFIDGGVPPSGWGWLEVTAVSRKPDPRARGDRNWDRITLFAKPVEASFEQIEPFFGYGRLLAEQFDLAREAVVQAGKD